MRPGAPESSGIEPPRSLLVLKPSSFGDIVHTLPAVARLKAAWPECRFSWLVNTEWMPLLEGNPDVDQVIEFPRRQFRGIAGLPRLGGWLRAVIRRQRPDLALDFQGLLRTALLGRLSGARALAGMADAREGAGWFYHETASLPPTAVHAVDRYLALAANTLKRRGRTTFSGSQEDPSFPLPDGEPTKDADGIAGGFILLHPFARGIGKSLSANIIKLFLQQNSKFCWALVGRCDAEIATQFDGCFNLLNKTTLPQLIWLIRRASAVVTVDSGPSHLAAALGRPMIAIHGWSDPRKVGPYRPDAWVWKNGRLVQMRALRAMPAEFFAPRPLEIHARDVEAICALATSLSHSCA